MFLGLLVLVVLIVTGIILLKNDSRDIGTMGVFGIISLFIATGHFLGTLVGLLCSYTKISDLEAFQMATKSAYEHVAEETKNMQISAPQQPGHIVDAARLEQLKVASERLRELRDKVAWYNEHVVWLQKCKKSWFFRMYQAEIPDTLQPIILSSSKG
jgi:hypothetical protein